MRRILTALFRRLLQIFFRRIEIVGAHHIPAAAPVILAVNHPNGLVDPLFIFGFVPRRVSFLAKAPLFTMPVVGSIVRAFDSIPVYRKQDNVIGTHEETFERAHDVLASGGAIAIFPEGTTHSDTRLREFKTGAVRIAIGSQLPDVVIVPAGIYYTEKQTFRSDALIAFGEPLECGGHGEPEPSLVRELTDRVEEALATLTLQADSHAALELIAHAEDIFTSDGQQPLAEELELRRRFIAGHHRLRELDPVRLMKLESRIRQFVAELGRFGLEPHELVPRVPAGTIARILILFPVAILGAVVHYLPYRLVDLLARRFSRGARELTATAKFLAALAIYPVTWIALAAMAWRWFGASVATGIVIVVPVLGFAALRVAEDLDDAVGRTRAVVHRLFSRDAHAKLMEERRAIRQEIAALAAELDMT